MDGWTAVSFATQMLDVENESYYWRNVEQISIRVHVCEG
jgi:hypothetical protein